MTMALLAETVSSYKRQPLDTTYLFPNVKLIWIRKVL